MVGPYGSVTQQTIICVERFLQEASARERKAENEGYRYRGTSLPYCRQDESTREREARIAKRRETCRRIDAFPKLDLPNGALGPVDIIRGMREERDTQILGTSLNQVVSSTEEERA